MTLVNIDLRNQGYETGPDDRVIFYSLLVREGDFGTISTAPVEVELTDGQATVDLAPGPVGVQIIAGQVADTRIKIGEVPPSGPTTLNAVMMVTPAYTPALQAMMIAAIERARDESLSDVERATATALAAAIAPLRDAADAANLAAQSADARASSAETLANQALSGVSAAEASARVAGASAVSADSRAQAAIGKSENAVTRVTALEAMAGLGPESPVDGQTANLIEQDDTLTRAALASSFAQVGEDGKLVGGVMPTLALAASPATGVSVTTGAHMSVFTFLNGELIGYENGRLYTSADGITWDDAGPSPLGQIPRKILSTLDGEIMCAINPSLHRSSGWGTGTLTWSKKMDVTPGSGIQPFGLNGRAGKFIVTEYSGERATSRYAYISTDDGHSFTQVWDSNEMHGPVDGPLTHIHGVEYDHYADRFYLSEGHLSASAGLYVSVDDGATWMRPPGLFEDPAPTTVDVTPDGLVCGSDSPRAGILGVVRQDNPMDEKFIHTWVWQTGKDGVIGFGASSFRDESTGIVYIGFRAGQDDVHPVIAGGTPTAAGLVWEWDGGPSIISEDVRNPVVANGRLYASGQLSGQNRAIRGHVASPGVPEDQSQSRVIGTRLTVGVGATASGLGGVAVGNSANSSGEQWSTAVGYQASAESDATALGTRSVADAGGTALGYLATNADGGDQVAVGTRAGTTGPSATAVGSRAESAASAVAVGASTTGGTSGVAVGDSAKSGPSGVTVGRNADSATGDNSVVVGANAKSTAGWATAVGSNSSSATGGAALGREATAAANSVSVGRSATSASGGIAIGREASAGQDMIAIGRGATSAVGGAISIGQDVVATSSNSVAFGARGIHLQPVTTTPVNPQSGGILYIRDIGGVMSLCVRMTAGPEMVIAPAAPAPVIE